MPEPGAIVHAGDTWGILRQDGRVFVPDRLAAVRAQATRDVLEPLRYRVPLERAIDAHDDRARQVARVAWRQVRREEAPQSFGVWLALASWRLPVPEPAVEWLDGLARLQEAPLGPYVAARHVLRDLTACREELALGPSLLGRVLAARCQTDEAACAAAREASDVAAMLARLDRDLVRAATWRGVSAAERTLRATLATLREAWEEVGGALVASAEPEALRRIEARRAAPARR